MTRTQIRSQILSLLSDISREGIADTINYLLGSDYFSAGCHSHHRWPGGLAQHSLEACRYALSNCGNLSRESVIIGTLLHDLCTAHSPLARDIHGHGRRSVAILEKVCGLTLLPAEREAILLHMHGNAGAMDTNPLARLVFKADKISAARRFPL